MFSKQQATKKYSSLADPFRTPVKYVTKPVKAKREKRRHDSRSSDSKNRRDSSASKKKRKKEDEDRKSKPKKKRRIQPKQINRQ